ncbi:MAG: DUF1365 domain-containing protein [Bacteriovoracaceae bacterium]
MGIENLRKPLIGEGRVMHSRPGVNSFTYPIFNLLLPIDQEVLNNFSKGFFWKILSKDYLDGSKKPLKEKIESFLEKNLQYQCDDIWLQTIPRMFGYGFNPVSFWYCYQKGELDAVLCEVNNTFGDRHFYFLKKNEKGELVSVLPKRFHVSPFFPIEGHYNFKFHVSSTETKAEIIFLNKEDIQLKTKLSLKLKCVEQVSSLSLLAKYGWMTPIIIFRIHLQAFKLWIKGVEFYSRPTPPKEQFTYDHKVS